MNSSEQLRLVVAKLLMISPGEIGSETTLQDLGTSLGGARLGLALKRAGLELPGNRVPGSFGELEMLIQGGATPGETGSPGRTVSMPQFPVLSQSEFLTGIDIQEIDTLPVANDYWEHEFYREFFDRAEIAYAVGKTEPRTHLAGFWCAKEALRKCDPSFAGTSPSATAVEHESSGRPYLVAVSAAGRTRLPHALSISHSKQIASAVVMTGPPVSAAPPAIVQHVTSAAPSGSGRRGLVTLALATCSLLLAIAALIRSFR